MDELAGQHLSNPIPSPSLLLDGGKHTVCLHFTKPYLLALRIFMFIYVHVHIDCRKQIFTAMTLTERHNIHGKMLFVVVFSIQIRIRNDPKVLAGSEIRYDEFIFDLVSKGS